MPDTLNHKQNGNRKEIQETYELSTEFKLRFHGSQDIRVSLARTRPTRLQAINLRHMVSLLGPSQ